MKGAEVIQRAEQARLEADAAKGTPGAISTQRTAEKWALFAKVAERVPGATWVTGTQRGLEEPHVGIIDHYAGSSIRILVPWNVDASGIDAHRIWIEAVSLSPEDNEALGDFWESHGCMRVPAVQW